MAGFGGTASERAGILTHLDNARVGPLQIRTFILCGLVAVLDGVDNQSIGVIAPVIAKDLNLSKAALGLIFSITQVGATIGALAFGPFADRFGRKTATIVALAGISLFTYLSAIAPGFMALLAVRFAAGIALAGAVPCILALGSEYAPLRLRGTITSIIFAGYPLGAALGGVMSAYILAHYDWRWVFYIGAIMPFLTIILIWAYVPESMHFLIGRGERDGQIVEIARKLGIPLEKLPDAAELNIQPKPRRQSVPIAQLFAGGLLMSTLFLWTLYFFSYATTKVMVVWLPSLLTDEGMDISRAAIAQASFNTGCAIGMAVAGRLVDKYGAARAMTPALIFCAACVAGIGLAGRNYELVLVASAGVGLFIGIGGSGAHSIAATIYPTAIRSTGLGWGLASSRLGQVVSPMLVATLLSAGVANQDTYYVMAAFPLVAALACLGFAGSETKRKFTNDDVPEPAPQLKVDRQ